MQMSVEANKAIVRRFIEKYQTNGREEIADELLADNFFDHSALPGFSPDREGVKELFKMLHGAFDGFRAEIFEQVAENDKVVTRKTFYGKHTGEFMGIGATNCPIELGVIDILRIKDGQLVEHWCQVDFAGLMNQITKN
jgi:predicted ester cyclase